MKCPGLDGRDAKTHLQVTSPEDAFGMQKAHPVNAFGIQTADLKVEVQGWGIRGGKWKILRKGGMSRSWRKVKSPTARPGRGMGHRELARSFRLCHPRDLSSGNFGDICFIVADV